MLKNVGGFLCFALLFGATIGEKKMWNFEFISLEANSSDENLVKIDLELAQKSRGSYGITGTVLINVDVKEGDNNMIEALVYRSATGSSDYKATPFTMRKQHFFSFLDTFYKETVMESLGKCSDLPVFQTKFQPPLEKKTYTLNDCHFTNDGLPPYMTEGFYKVVLVGTGDVDYTIHGILKVENEEM